MAISVSSRVRNAMVGLTLGLSLLFTVLIFLLVYVIEDQVFVNQIKVEKAAFERILLNANLQKIQNWQPSNANIQRIDSVNDLPKTLSQVAVDTIVENQGVHEYFDDDNALFVASFSEPSTGEPYYLVYDVKNLLVVRNTKGMLFFLIGGLTFIIAIAAVMLARRLSKATLAPVSRLSRALQEDDLDHVVIELANEFSEDEIGVLTRELALALERIREASQREYEFNRGVSHELRSPIQVAQSATELLQIYAAENDTAIDKPVARLKRSVAEMNEVAEAFLWLASDRAVDANEKCSVAMLQDTLSTVQSTFPTHEIAISTNLNESFVYPVPSTVLSVVLRNLVRNAVIHGEPPLIKIDIHADRIAVANMVNLTNKNDRNFGVGLSIVQRICDRFDCELKSELQSHRQYVSSIEFNRERTEKQDIKQQDQQSNTE